MHSILSKLARSTIDALAEWGHHESIYLNGIALEQLRQLVRPPLRSHCFQATAPQQLSQFPPRGITYTKSSLLKHLAYLHSH
jgi:hypothetical protein